MKHSQIPSEWSAQEAVWLTWPSMPNWWQGARAESLEAFANLVALISRYETVRINCPIFGSLKDGISDQSDAAKRIARAGAIMSKIEFFNHPTNDVWCRDSGAIFRLSDTGKLEALDFSYNSWGGKFPPWELDDALATKMGAAAKAEIIDCRELTCEGGALEVDGNGTLLTTECVVLNKNRNPHFTKSAAEKFLHHACGVSNVIWLKDGIVGDDTDGHIDNIARFAPNNKIVASVCEKSNSSYGNLQENLEVLKNAHDAFGNFYEVLELPVPAKPIIINGYDGTPRVLPASYANWLVINGAVIVPSYGQDSDKDAENIVRWVYPDREIKMFDCRVFLREGGAVHCLTQQQPA